MRTLRTRNYYACRDITPLREKQQLLHGLFQRISMGLPNQHSHWKRIQNTTFFLVIEGIASSIGNKSQSTKFLQDYGALSATTVHAGSSSDTVQHFEVLFWLFLSCIHRTRTSGRSRLLLTDFRLILIVFLDEGSDFSLLVVLQFLCHIICSWSP